MIRLSVLFIFTGDGCGNGWTDRPDLARSFAAFYSWRGRREVYAMRSVGRVTTYDGGWDSGCCWERVLIIGKRDWDLL